MKTETGRFRQKKVSFTATSNKVLFDPKLDMDTKTLHNMITYYISIPEFTLFKAHLQKQTGVGQRAFNRMWKQLKDNGYLMQYKFKDDKGTFYYEYDLFDEPQCVAVTEQKKLSPGVQNVAVEEPTAPCTHYAYMDDADMGDAVHGNCIPINKTLKNKILPNKIINSNKQQQPKEVVVAINHTHLATIDEDVVNEFKHAFGRRPSPKVQESLRGYLNRFEKDVVLQAMDIAGNKNKGWDYAQGILKIWSREEVFTFDAMFEYEEQYR